MPWTVVVWLLFAFLGLALLFFDVRASFIVLSAFVVFVLGMYWTMPPVHLLNQLIGHVLAGAVLGALVSHGPRRTLVRLLPLLLALELALLSLSTVPWRALQTFALAIGLKVVVVPLAMFAVIAAAQRADARRLKE